MSDPSKDEWPKRNPGIPRDHLFALGVIAAVYNSLERDLESYFLLYTGYQTEIGTYVFANANNRLRVDLIQRAASASKHPNEIKENVAHFISCFEICAENRNVLMHATASVLSHDGAVVSVVFNKPARDEPHRLNRFLVSLPEIREVADAIGATHRFALHLFRHIVKEHEPKFPYPPVAQMPSGSCPLPEKCEKPKKLIPASF